MMFATTMISEANEKNGVLEHGARGHNGVHFNIGQFRGKGFFAVRLH